MKQQRQSSTSALSSSQSSYIHCQSVWWAELADPWRLV